MNTTQQTTAPRGVASAIAWGLAPVGWFFLLVGWVFMDGDLSGQVQTALGIVILALPAPWLLWASWRMPRPRVKTYLAEGGALSALLLSLLVTAVYFLLGAGPTETASIGFTAAYFAASAVLIAAAWPLPGRRIAYGMAALGCAIFAISVQVPQWRTGAHMDSKLAIADEVLLNILLGAIVLGVLLQIAWWLRGKLRAVLRTAFGPDPRGRSRVQRGVSRRATHRAQGASCRQTIWRLPQAGPGRLSSRGRQTARSTMMAGLIQSGSRTAPPRPHESVRGRSRRAAAIHQGAAVAM